MYNYVIHTTCTRSVVLVRELHLKKLRLLLDAVSNGPGYIAERTQLSHLKGAITGSFVH